MPLHTQVLADAPIAYWKLDEPSGTTIGDSSGNGRHGTIVGSYTRLRDGTCDGAGRVATRLHDGGYGILPSFGAAQLNGDFTLEAWLRPTTDPEFFPHQYPGILMLGTNAGSSGDGWLFYFLNNGAPAYDGEFAFKRNVAGGNFSTDADMRAKLACFRHWVVTYDADTQELIGYLDGQPVKSWSGSLGTKSGTDLRMGINQEYSTPHTADADFAHVAMYDTTLSASRVLAHFNAGGCTACGAVKSRRPVVGSIGYG